MVQHDGRDAGSVVDAEGLAKTYKRGTELVQALRDATLGLDRGEIVALVGPSGSGKTTLLNILCGWERADEGTVRWRGAPQDNMARLPWDEMAIVPQRLGLIEELSVAENIELPERLSTGVGDKPSDRVSHLLERLGLDQLSRRLPGETSLGEQQRTSLARALVLSPRLLLADEPAGHQDGEWARSIFGVMQEEAKQGTTCLVATHNKETIKFCDRSLEIEDGRVHSRPH
ncbi:MAG: ATP-binding cassette domain-containing protein [Actinobacteria bacterium]|nr:ATP-binding cassette domain-containing protein [Actinomycetota bacterium]